MISPTIYALATGGSLIGGIVFSPLFLLFIILVIGYIMAALFSIISIIDKKLDIKYIGKAVAGNWTTVWRVAKRESPVSESYGSY